MELDHDHVLKISQLKRFTLGKSLSVFLMQIGRMPSLGRAYNSRFPSPIAETSISKSNKLVSNYLAKGVLSGEAPCRRECALIRPRVDLGEHIRRDLFAFSMTDKDAQIRNIVAPSSVRNEDIKYCVSRRQGHMTLLAYPSMAGSFRP
jgi:hypothetical protein